MRWKIVLGVVTPILAMPLTLVCGDVLQHHRNSARTGMYVDRHITRAAAAATHRDTTFDAVLPGPTYAQPLYVNDGPQGTAAFLVATEQDVVLALDASSGSRLWTSKVGQPVPLSQLPCGDIDPLGITGTPIADPDARVVYVAAMTTPDQGKTKQQKVFALSLDDGTVLPGWPVDVSGLPALAAHRRRATWWRCTSARPRRPPSMSPGAQTTGGAARRS